MTGLRDPLFWAGLVIRLVLIAALQPVVQTQWFVPFLMHMGPESWSDPWSGFLAAGGDIRAFPYGIPYLIAYWPLTALIGGVAPNLGLSASAGAGIGLGLSLLVLDYALLRLLWAQGLPRRKVLVFYWLAPVCLYISYVHGQLDLLPTALVFAAVAHIGAGRMAGSGAALGAALAAKFSSLVAAPIFALLLLRNVSRSRHWGRFVAAFCLATLVLLGPAFLSAGFNTMAAGSQEIAKVFLLRIELGQMVLYLAPILYGMLLYAIWRLRRISFDLFVNLIGIAFLGLLTVTPASPGWFLWVMPYLVIYQIRQRGSAVLASQAFLAVVFVRNLVLAQGAGLRFSDYGVFDTARDLMATLPPQAFHLLDSLQIVLAIVLLAQMVRSSIFMDRFYQVSRRPVRIGIAGDSGSGKDTLAGALHNCFTGYKLSHISGDDYHLWDRNRAGWNTVTHLNPQANDLDKLSADVVDLVNGRPIRKRHYDHDTGQLTRPESIKPGDIIVVSGLHALLPLQLRGLYDLMIFLDMDETLRRFFKVRRDVSERGHSLPKVLAALKRRAGDRERFVQPQADFAHLIFSLKPETELPEPGKFANCPLPHLQLVVKVHSGLQFDAVMKTLTAICGLAVSEQSGGNGLYRSFAISGMVLPETIAAAARMAVPDFERHFESSEEWAGGPLGLMQLMTVAALMQLVGHA